MTNWLYIKANFIDHSDFIIIEVSMDIGYKVKRKHILLPSGPRAGDQGVHPVQAGDHIVIQHRGQATLNRTWVKGEK